MGAVMRYQPQGGYYALRSDVAYAFVPMSGRLVNANPRGTAATAISGNSAKVYQKGVGVAFSSGGATFDNGLANIPLSLTNGVTVIIVFSPNSQGVKGSLVSLGAGGDTLQISTNTSNGIQIDKQQVINMISTPDAGIVAKGCYTAGVSYKSGSLAVALDGKIIGSNTSNSISGAVTSILIARRSGDLGETFAGGILGVFILQRNVTQEELSSLTRNPWQLFMASTEDDDYLSSDFTIVSAEGTSSGITSVSSQAAAICEVDGSSNGVATISSQVNSIWSIVANSNGGSTTDNNSGAIWEVNGVAEGVSNCSISSNTIWNSVGNSTGTSSTNTTTNSVWVVVGNSSGASTADGSTTATTILSADGNSVGSSTTDAIAAAIISATGGSVSASFNSANAVAIQITVGSSSGASSVDAIVQAIKDAVGNAVGSCTVQGISDGGVPPSELTPITGNISVTIITAQYGIQKLTSVFGASLL